MSARSPNKGPAYKGHDAHIHVTVSEAQRAKVLRLAKRDGVTVSVLVRGIIDGLEVSK